MADALPETRPATGRPPPPSATDGGPQPPRAEPGGRPPTTGPWALAGLAVCLLAWSLAASSSLWQAGEEALPRDIARMQIPNLAFLGECLAGGHLPFIHPRRGAGTPFMADPQTGCGYPPTWLAARFEPRTGFLGFQVAHLWWGALGWLALLLALGSAWPAALAGALTATAASHSLVILEWMPLTAGTSWVPWILGAARTGSPFLCLGAIALAILTGHAYLWVMMTVLVPAAWWLLPAGRRPRFALGVLLVPLLTAPIWMGYLSLSGEVLPHGIEGPPPVTGFGVRNLAHLVFPGLYEDLAFVTRGGRILKVTGYENFSWAGFCYVGLLPLLLVAVGWRAAPASVRRLALWFGGCGVFLAMGLPWLGEVFPAAFRHMHHPASFFQMTTWGLLLLFPWAVETLWPRPSDPLPVEDEGRGQTRRKRTRADHQKDPPPPAALPPEPGGTIGEPGDRPAAAPPSASPGPRAFQGLGIVFVLFGLAHFRASWLALHDQANPFWFALFTHDWETYLFGAAFAFLLAGRFARPAPRPAVAIGLAVLLLLLHAGDLVLRGFRAAPQPAVVPSADAFWSRVPPTTMRLKWMDVHAAGSAPSRANTPARLGWWQFDDYNPPFYHPALTDWSFRVIRSVASDTFEGMLAWAGIGLVGGADTFFQAPASWTLLSDYSLGEHKPTVRLYRAGAAPAAMLTTPSTLARLDDGEVPAPEAPLPPGALDWQGNEILVDLPPPGGASAPVLFVPITPYRDWQAMVDGTPAIPLERRGFGLAIPLPPQARQVVLRYRPRFFVWGVATALFGWAALFGLALYNRRNSVIGEEVGPSPHVS
ncbi:MAG: YfhO family protein [Candidatus Riflebacteria bacterium]|nr:YfhO family protein [Candidatus Riflebacteria bacterium]